MYEFPISGFETHVSFDKVTNRVYNEGSQDWDKRWYSGVSVCVWVYVMEN